MFINEKEVLETVKMGFSDFFLIVLLPPILFECSINIHKVT